MDVISYNMEAYPFDRERLKKVAEGVHERHEYRKAHKVTGT